MSTATLLSERLLRHKIFIQATLVVLSWRLLIEAYAIFILHRLPFGPITTQKTFPITIWRNWDGNHYLSIAEHGYQAVQYAFFPLYPAAIHLTATILQLGGHHHLIYTFAGLLVTTVALVGAIYYLYQLSLLEDPHVDAAWRSIMLLLFFPSAIFLGAIYTEAVFLCLTIGSWYYTKQNRMVLAGLFGAAATLTRLIGIWLFVALALDYILAYQKNFTHSWKQLIPLMLIPGALLAYMAFQWHTTGDALQFLHAQQAWSRSVSLHSMTAVLQQLQQGLDLAHFGSDMIAPMYDAVATLVFMGLSIVLLAQRRWAEGVYSLLALITPLASGQTTGMVRYCLVIFPIFLLLGRLTRHQLVFSFLFAFFTIFLALLSIHYLNGWWLA